MSDTPEILKSVSDVIAALGGISEVKAITGSESPQVVTNWQARDRFASHTYLQITEALRLRSLLADPLLWGITPAPVPEAAE